MSASSVRLPCSRKSQRRRCGMNPQNPHFNTENNQPEGGKSARLHSEEKAHQFPQRFKRGHTRLQWLQKIRDHGLHCHYCECALTTSNVTKDHLTPLCRDGEDTIDNIVPCCLACNAKKTWRTKEEFLKIRPYLSTNTRYVGSRYKPKPGTCAYYDLTDRELLKSAVAERERVSWAWRNPA